MNQSHLIHIAVALVFQVAIGLLTGNWWAGGAVGIGWFISREHASRQYKLAGWTKGHGGVSIKDMKPWEGMDIINWTTDAKLDALMPTAVVLAVAAFMQWGM